MPVTSCQANGRPGFKWGDAGKCYTYIPGDERSKNRAKQKALFQGIAIGERPGVRRDAIQNEKPFVSHLRVLGFTNRKFKTAKIRRRVNLLYPKGIENVYSLSLRRLVLQWKKLYLQMIDPRLEAWAQEAYALKPKGSVNVKSDNTLLRKLKKEKVHIHIKQDAWTDELKDIMEGYQVSLTESIEGLPKLTDGIAARTSQWNQAQWQKVIRAHLGINLLTQEPWLVDQLKSFTNQNVQLVTKLAEETRADIERIISDGYQRGLRVESIRGKLLSESKLTPGRFKKTRTRANLISRDQVGKLNGQLSQIRQTEVDIEQYWWNTVVDEKVRSSHMAMNGKLCRWDDATVYKDSPDDPEWKARSSIGGIELHPGQDYQCRCFGEPDFSEVFESEEIVKEGVGIKGARPVKMQAPSRALREKEKRIAKRKALVEKKLIPSINKIDFQRKIVKSQFEIGAIYDKKGRQLAQFTQRKRVSVVVPESMVKYIKGNRLVHNHPVLKFGDRGVSFSFPDLQVALTSGAVQEEVVSGKSLYKISHFKKFRGSELDFFETYYKTYESIKRKSTKKYVGMVRRRLISIPDANTAVQHEIIDLFGQKTKLFKYKRIDL